MPRRIALVVALSLTVVVGSVLLMVGAGWFRQGQAEERGQQVSSTVPAVDLTSGRVGSRLLDDDMFDDGDDDDGWEGRGYSGSPYSPSTPSGSPYSGERYEEGFEQERADYDD